MHSHVHNLKFKCKDCKEVRLRKWQRKINNEDSSDHEASNNEKTEGNDVEEVKDDDKIKNENSSHCHCHLFTIDEELLATMSDGQPNRRYREDLKKKMSGKT